MRCQELLELYDEWKFNNFLFENLGLQTSSIRNKINSKIYVKSVTSSFCKSFCKISNIYEENKIEIQIKIFSAFMGAEKSVHDTSGYESIKRRNIAEIGTLNAI